MVTLRNPGTVEEFPFDVLSFKSFPAPFRKEYRWGIGNLDSKFCKQLSSIPFDIVHAHSPFSTGIVARQIARNTGIPLVATLHTKYKEDFKRIIKWDRLVDSLVIKNIVKFYEAADDVWTVNEASIETLREYGYKGEVFVMNNGSDIPMTERDDETRISIMDEFGLNAAAPLFTYVGHHERLKNISLIINALDILNKQGVDFNMLFIGEGSAREEFITRAEKLGLKRKVHFVGRVNDRDVMKRVYSSTDAVLFPSLYDTSSLVTKEASSCLCPTVFVEGSTTSHGVVDGSNGFLAKNEMGDFAAKIKQIINTDGLSLKAGYGARDTLYVSWRDIVGKVYERYAYLIDRGKNAADLRLMR
jgi:glycosyltransferase involved in cell wall biosynthesis